ncbi:TetR/AcrR family transcriptional regulator [Sphingosinicella rhizophila]|uniref:TetR/AcrR family transcriptional regulator n=1 Tax=Sphingosinicella rhizophila TaxID=3050082 RepID=A0ABU3Q411_9SPHN|nr:TetR/AcrR family transcriptional regulator [Sphingosinicella sp. GR2756]MDT9598139.1 TetR/AcrR family transcriptional regulator [Sphingosinicella sp. GR2756]
MRAKRTRAQQTDERRLAIVAAALDAFVESGFEATKISDVAARAGVAKGTVYLHFADKEALFEAIVRDALSPVVQGIGAISTDGVASVRSLFEAFALPLMLDIVESRRGDVLRLLISEGRRFPRLAEFYHAEILTPAKAHIQRLLCKAVENGELRNPGLAEYPLLVAAPMLMSVIWAGLFQRLDPIDFEALFRTHLDTLFMPGA